jgi:CxxC motif-containing protein
LRAELEGEGARVEGASCGLGRDYAATELKDPRRLFSGSVRARGGSRPLVPVWTPEPVPKGKLLEIAALARSITVDAPVDEGQVIVADACGTGIPLVASAFLPRGH